MKLINNTKNKLNSSKNKFKSKISDFFSYSKRDHSVRF